MGWEWAALAGQVVGDVLRTLGVGFSPVEHFMHPLEVAFGSNIAYAVLIRTGSLQGNRLNSFCDRLHADALEMYELLRAENPQVIGGIEIDGNKTRCSNHISECQKRISRLTPRFVKWAIICAVVAVTLMLLAGVWPEASLPNILILVGFLLLIAPVPAGLYITYSIVKEGEDAVRGEYSSFFHALEYLKDKPKEQTQKAIDNFKTKLKAKSPGPLTQMLNMDSGALRED